MPSTMIWIFDNITAMAILGVSEDKITKDIRRIAKQLILV